MEGRDLKLMFPSPAEAPVIPLAPEMPLSCLRLPWPGNGQRQAQCQQCSGLPLAQGRPCRHGPPPRVAVNFMCPLGWATRPRYLVKHYSGSCEGVFWMRLTFR